MRHDGFAAFRATGGEPFACWTCLWLKTAAGELRGTFRANAGSSQSGAFFPLPARAP